jgi:hypothetical protein
VSPSQRRKAKKRARILREGFERGAQWAMLDLAYRNGSIGIVDANGAIGDKERDAAIRDMLRSLFVPKPGGGAQEQT